MKAQLRSVEKQELLLQLGRLRGCDKLTSVLS